ncbi:MAG: malate dehydrogenase [Fibrobacterota bacterium]
MDRPKISIIGAGQVGSETARVLATKRLGRYVLVDKREGLAKGRALDISHIDELGLSENDIQGSEDLAAIAGSDIVVVTAGYPRKKGMSREDLLSINLEVISEISEKIQTHAPEAVIIMVTNPLDAMTYAAWRLSGFHWNKVIGMAGALDASRFAYYIAREAGVNPADVSPQVLGSHGQQMVPLVSNTSIGGMPVKSLLTADQLQRAIAQTIDAGNELVSLLQTGSAFFAASRAVASVVEAIVSDSKKIVNCSTLSQAHYDLDRVYIGLPVVLGKQGVERIISLDLSEEEYRQLQDAASHLKTIQDKIEECLVTSHITAKETTT